MLRYYIPSDTEDIRDMPKESIGVIRTLAFGGLNIWITLGQFLAKVFGGFVWSLVLFRGENDEIKTGN